MVDFIRYFATDRESFLDNIENSKHIELRGNFNFKTGEAKEYPKTGYYHNMFLKITENQASVKGSIHKYFNLYEDYGEQNFNDFSYCDFQYALEQLTQKLVVDLEDTKVTNLEFGINIEIDKDPQKIIDDSILMYNYKPPSINEKFYGKGDYLEFKFTEYSIKIYNKSKQNKIKNRYILRVELKVVNSKYLKLNFGIRSLQDINRRSFDLMFKKLIAHFDKLLIVDSLSLLNSQRIDEIVLFSNGINPNYWANSDNFKSDKVKGRIKRDFNNLLENNSMLKTKKYLRGKLVEKFDDLMNCNYNELQKVA